MQSETSASTAEAVQTRHQQSNEESLHQEEQFPPGDTLNDCVALCQEQRWREALALCQLLYEKASRKNDQDMCAGLESARVKIEYSLRRQMASAFVSAAQQLLEKEFLLDVS